MTNLNHLAIIMDGNGRWANERGHQRIFGHVRGVKVVREIINESMNLGIPYLTLFAFSSENWSRSPKEVTVLMKLLHKFLKIEKENLLKENIIFRVIGERDKLPSQVKSLIQECETKTKNNTGLNLTLAVSYGSRAEISKACQKIALKLNSGEIKQDQINEKLLSQNLESSFLPDPDLIIRTSGEFRLSNFLLWQSAYSEIFICEKNWPEFTTTDLKEACQNFFNRNRRYGKANERPLSPPELMN